MKMLTLLLFVLFVFLTNNISAQPEIVFDGTLVNFEAINEFPLEHMQYDRKTSLMYAFARDSFNFYVFVRVADEKMQQELIHRGLNVWIDTTNRRKKAFGMRFPSKSIQQRNKQKPQQMKEALSDEEKEEPKRPVENSFDDFHEMMVYGLTESKSKDFLFLPSKNGIDAKITRNNAGIMFLKYKLPFQYFGKAPKFSIGMELAPFEKNSRVGGQTGQFPMRAQMSSGGMDMSVGGRSGGRGGGRGSLQSSQQTPQLILWIRGVYLYK